MCQIAFTSIWCTTLVACSLQGSAQWEFMAKDLAAVDRSVTPWLVVGHHRPYYAPTVSPAVLCNLLQWHLPPSGPACTCLHKPDTALQPIRVFRP